jgi:hypothetical protein
MSLQVLHVARAFSAQPTLGECLDDAIIIERPLEDALRSELSPDLIWISSAAAGDVDAVRRRFPSARILATPPRRTTSEDVVQLIAGGADLVLQDEGVMLAAAGLAALSRRLLAAAC